ncbi:hypothetical protein HELRODRAFT_178280 [Helobdella robusta]|uniref:Tetraspanin n=1 Tax=Helobdella robusta TaxID=6412 RepID=T1FD11_HELRO|nr:hypothetical protein HELRODRAFT_178280 [Helobdella robusta]ESN97171.1 hypothetical protein HELRODRAFT_178280 [Helobdella robusta]
MFFEIWIDEGYRMLLLRSAMFLNFVALGFNKLNILVVRGLYNLMIHRYKPLIRTLDLYYYPSVSYLISITSMGISAAMLWISYLALFKSKRVGLLNAMILTQYMFFYYVTSTFVAIVVTAVLLVGIEDMFVSGLRPSMNLYRTYNQSKVIIDNLQITHQCCGDLSYSDWFTIAWIRSPYINLNDALEREELSCCSIYAKRPCIFTHVHDHNYHHNYNYATDLTLHATGCRQVMLWRTTNLLIWILGLNSACAVLSLITSTIFR